MKGQNLVTPEDAGKRVSFHRVAQRVFFGEVVGLFEFYDHEAATYLVRRSDGTVARAGARRPVRQGHRALSASPALLDELRALAVPLARRAAEIQRDGLRTASRSARSPRRETSVTEIDRAAERAIVDGILAERPDDAILGEEGTDRNGRRGCAG